jgi:hypothetical protein
LLLLELLMLLLVFPTRLLKDAILKLLLFILLLLPLPLLLFVELLLLVQPKFELDPLLLIDIFESGSALLLLLEFEVIVQFKFDESKFE